MTIRNKLKKLITGLSIPQEYLCLSREDFMDPLSVFISLDKESTSLSNVTYNHLLLGYKPVIIGLYGLDEANSVTLTHRSSVTLSFYFKSCRIASLSLRLVDTKLLDNRKIFLYKALHGDHEFLNDFHQIVNRQRVRFKKQEPGNVDLPGNLIDQVRIAYAVPRVIGLIALSDGTKVNMFPTDLHGPVGKTFYLGSLRIGGKANQQVEQIRKIVIAQMSISNYKQVYQLGKNHMRDLVSHDRFVLHYENSAAFGFPLPAGVLRYWELTLMDSYDIGIHRIHMYKVVNFTEVSEHGKTLAHIHQYYAQWRLDQGIPTELFLR